MIATPSRRRGVDLSVALPLLVVHLLGLGLAPFSFSWLGLGLCIALYLFTGFGVTAGAHRLFTHRSFVPAPIVRELLALAFLLSAQGSLRRWVRDHQIHHRYSDQASDPHSPAQRGFLGAHLGWLWSAPPSSEEDRALYTQYTRGLDPGRIGRFFRSGTRLLTLHLSFMAAVFAVGLILGGVQLGLSLLIWGVLLRIVLVMHSTFLINSATHRYGQRPYKTRDDSRNLWWVAVLALGEGWHNNHHHRPSAANNGFHRPWEIDLTFLLLLALARLGLVFDLKVYVPTKSRTEIWFPSSQNSVPDDFANDRRNSAGV